MANTKNNEKEFVLKNLRLSVDVVNKIKRLAEKDNRTFNNMVETILLRWGNDSK